MLESMIERNAVANHRGFRGQNSWFAESLPPRGETCRLKNCSQDPQSESPAADQFQRAQNGVIEMIFRTENMPA